MGVQNGNVTDPRAKELYSWAKTVRMQQNASTGDVRLHVAPGRSNGNAKLYGKSFRIYTGAALRSMHANSLKEGRPAAVSRGLNQNTIR